jgi:hypothetical protein
MAKQPKRNRSPHQSQLLAVLLVFGTLLTCITLELETGYATSVLTAALGVATVIARKR